MFNTLRIILSLRNTININGLLYGIRRLPIIGKHISDRIYGIWIIKLLALIFSVIKEIMVAFFGKLLIFAALIAVTLLVSHLNDLSKPTIFLYGYVLISIAGSFLYNLFAASTEVRYGVFLLGMDAKKYVTALFTYNAATIFAGYTLFGIPTALVAGVPWYIALLIPVSGVGFKAATVGIQMSLYSGKINAGKKTDRKGRPLSIAGNPNLLVLLVFLICVAGGIASPLIIWDNMFYIPAIITVLSALALIPGFFLMKRFPYGLYRTALFAESTRSELVKAKATQNVKKSSVDQISETEGITTGVKGFRFLNDLFIKRHRRLLWGSVIKITVGTAIAIVLASVVIYVELKMLDGDPSEALIRGLYTTKLSSFPFILYFINRGARISQTMFANCDSSLLMFGFYKTPKSILTMFRLRIMSMVKLNLLPAFLLAAFGVVVLAITGGEDYRFQYLLTFLSIMLTSVFFSVHHLALYYLMQPYTSEYKIKSKGYNIVSATVYFVCWMLFNNNAPAKIFAPAAAVVTVIYIVVSCALVYKYAPKTFRIK